MTATRFPAERTDSQRATFPTVRGCLGAKPSGRNGAAARLDAFRGGSHDEGSLAGLVCDFRPGPIPRLPASEVMPARCSIALVFDPSSPPDRTRLLKLRAHKTGRC
jgi:hypothetical protein